MNLLSRRSFAVVAGLSLLGACGLGALSSIARADVDATAAALADARSRYDGLKALIDELVAQYQQLCVELESTLGQIDAKAQQIADIQEEIDALLAVPAEQADEEVLAELETRQADLAAQKAELETLRTQKSDQLAEVKRRQDEATQALNEADAEVKALAEQYDRELVARAQAEADEKAKADQAADQVQGETPQPEGQDGDSTKDKPSGEGKPEGAGKDEDKDKEDEFAQITEATRTRLREIIASGVITEAYPGSLLAAVLEACITVSSTGEGYCASWVTEVYDQAGVGLFWGNACDMYADWCTISDISYIKPGMIIATPSHNWTNDGQIYGHVGIYIGKDENGEGQVVDNLGYIRMVPLERWVASYDNVVAPRCGWLGGVRLVEGGDEPVDPPAPDNKPGFSDVDADAWYASYVAYVRDAGLMTGYSDTGLFGPDNAVSRAEVAAVLCRHATGYTPQGAGDCFYDVWGDEWYAGVVEWCYHNSIVTGERDEYGDETGYFRPNDCVTREQLATMVHRYALTLGMGSEVGDISAFDDAWAVSDYALHGLSWCNLYGIITGDTTYGYPLLNPHGYATRAQMAKILTVLVRDVL